MKKSGWNWTLKLRVLIELGFLPDSIFPAFLPRILGSSCILGLKLSVWIFSTSLLWMGRPNSPPILRYFGLSPNPNSTGETRVSRLLCSFSRSLLNRSSRFHFRINLDFQANNFHVLSSTRFGFELGQNRDLQWVKIPPKIETRRGRWPRIPSFSRIAFCPPCFWSFRN